MTGEAAAQGRREQRAHLWRAALILVVSSFAALLFFWDWNWFKAPLERRVSAATGRSFHVGNLDVDLGRTVVVRIEDAWLSNVPWSLVPEMAKADLLRLEMPFWPMLRGERILRRVDLVRPALLLERTRDGTANWQFQDEDAHNPPRADIAWSFGEVRVHDGRLDVRDAPLNTNLFLTVDSAEPEPGATNVRLLGHGSGRYRGRPFQFNGWADTPVALRAEPDAACHIDFSVRAGATRARAYGALRVPVDPSRFRVRTELRGDDLGDLYPLVGLVVPSTPPYSVRGDLERKGRVFTLRDIEGRIGDSDVAGVATLDRTGAKPWLRGDIVSTHLDLDDVGVAIGLPPSVKEGESASPKQRAEAARHAASPRVLPDEAFDLRKLGAMNADVHVRADDVDAGKWPVQSFAVRVQLRDSVLLLDPLRAGFADGTVAGRVRLDARHDPIDTAAKLAIRSVDLEKVMPHMQPPNIGTIGGNIDFEGNGNSVAAMLATADGNAQLAMGSGHFSNLLLELAGLDVAESLKFLLSKDKTVKLRCAYGDFKLADGTARTHTLVFDTTDTVIFGEGKVDLGQEALALELRPKPKDISPVSLRGPLEVGGTFKDPTFHPQARSLAARAAAAVALYTLAPPAALLALIETGPGENVDCHTGEKHADGKDEGKGKGKDKRKDKDKDEGKSENEAKVADKDKDAHTTG